MGALGGEIMSLRYEQYWSLLKTKTLLQELLTVDKYPKTKREMRDRVYSCLRHFPPLLKSGEPMWSRDPFTKDELQVIDSSYQP